MNLLDIYDTWRKRKNYEKAVEMSKIGFALNHQYISSIEIKPLEKHFKHEERLTQYKQLISTWNNKKHKNINFGDSISDFTRPQFEIGHDGIFSIGGSWAHHMQQMIEDLHPELSKFDIKNITIGTLGGNPMLVYVNTSEVIQSSLSCLTKLRELYPVSRIIVYGIPSVFNINAKMNSNLFDLKMIEWCKMDRDARFLSLKEHFGTGFARLIPTSKWSSDGVHFNERGAAKLNSLLMELMK